MPPKDREISEMARLLGSRGGKQAAKNMTREERRERSRKGAAAREANKKRSAKSAKQRR